MVEIEARETIRAPRERVFDALSDHERFFRNCGVRRCAVIRPGTSERNGLGAVREIDAAPAFRFREEVVRFERPARLDYQIRSVMLLGRRLPMRHELGWLELTERDGVTDVRWRSRYTFAVPIVGDAIARTMARRAQRAFGALLRQAKRELEATGERAAAGAS
jgi:uncharacterized protein YndB with AHSA1/START domain